MDRLPAALLFVAALLAPAQARAGLMIPFDVTVTGPSNLAFTDNAPQPSQVTFSFNYPPEQNSSFNTVDANIGIRVVDWVQGSGGGPWVRWTDSYTVLGVTLRDDRSLQEGAVSFLVDWLYPAPSDTEISHPVQSIVLGSNNYTVTASSYGSTSGGVIVSVEADPISPAGSPSPTPEPSSLVLAGLGIVGAALWRRRATSAAV